MLLKGKKRMRLIVKVSLMTKAGRLCKSILKSDKKAQTWQFEHNWTAFLVENKMSKWLRHN